jgi:SAM-dependent methyltransferase
MRPARERSDPALERAHFEGVLAARGALYWAERTAAGRRRRDLRSARLIERAGLAARPDAMVLEIGCGTGEFTRPLARCTPARLVGLDVAPAVVAEAAREAPPNVRLVAGDVEHLPFADASVDAVIGNAVLHHLRLDRTIPELLRVLRPAGRLCFAEPNMLNPQVFLERNVRWIGRRLDNSPGETAFVRWRLRRDLAALGVGELDIQPFDFLYPLTPRPLIGAVERLGRVLEGLPVVAEIAGSLLISGVRRPA